MKNTILLLLLLFNSALTFGQEVPSGSELHSQKADTIYSSPYVDGLSFLKVRLSNKESVYLSVTLHSTLAVEKPTGASIQLDNGRFINKPSAAITVKPLSNNTYVYSSLIELTQKDISLLTSYGVFRFKLYIYYNEVKEKERLRVELLKLLDRS